MFERTGLKEIAGSPSTKVSARGFFYWPQEQMRTTELAEKRMTQSIYNIAKAPLGWLIYGDGVKVGGVFGSKVAAFEAATVAATVAVRDGAGVQINVPSAPEAGEIPGNYILLNR